MNEEKKKNEIIRSELNIEKWPIFTTSTFKGKSKELTRTIKLANGDIETRKVVIGRINNTEVGVFRTFDLKGFWALLKIWENQGRPAQKNVTFNFKQIAEILELSWGGKTFNEIKAMMMRLRKIPIDWTNSFYNREKQENERLIESFTILSDLRIFERGKSDGQMSFSFSSFAFDKRLVANLLNNYSKPLLLSNILKFKKEISILLYRYIDLVMNDKEHFERRTKELLADLDLSPTGYPHPAQRKKLLDPVLKELLGVEITSGVITVAELQRTKNDKDYKVVFEKRRKESVAVVETSKVDEELFAPTDIVSELISRGISPGVAQSLAKNHPEVFIREKLEVFDLLRAGKSSMISKNPAGWLRSAIEQDYSAPANLETKEKKQKREKATKEAKEQYDLRLKIESYKQLRDAEPESQVWWPLERWKKDFTKNNDRLPTHEEVEQEKALLIAKLPSNEELQMQYFGKILFPEDIK